MNLWAIGDIHGCYQELYALMTKLINEEGLRPEKDVVVFLGDYIDRGPDSKKVIETLMQWHKKYPHWVFLYGNHEDIMRDALFRSAGGRYGVTTWFANGGKETWKSYGGHWGRQINDTWEAPKNPEFTPEHLDFLFKETVYLYEDDNYVFVHGGLVPEASIQESLQYLDTLLWARDGFIDSDWDWGKKVVFGHTPAYKPHWGKFGYPIILPNKIGLDGAVCPPANQNLIAVKLPQEEFFLQPSFYGRTRENPAAMFKINSRGTSGV